MFILLLAIGYLDNKVSLKAEFFTSKTIHGALILIPVLHYILQQWFIIIVLIYNISRYTWRVFFLILSISLQIFSYFVVFYIKLSWKLIFSCKYQIFFVCNFKHSFFAAFKEIHKLKFWSTTTSANIKSLLSTPRKHW